MQIEHQHNYDSDDKQICCNLEEKINQQSRSLNKKKKEVHHENDGHDHDHHHDTSSWKPYILAGISGILLLSGLIIEHYFNAAFFTDKWRILWYVLAYLPVAIPVIGAAFEALKHKQFFNEFTLMTIATIGAFAIGEYPEAVAVMLFYAVGELFQMAAVEKARNNIAALLDVRPNIANVLRNGATKEMHPEEVTIGETIQIKSGEKVPLDGHLLSVKASLNTAALTGESKPQSKNKGDNILAGSINLDDVIKVKVEKHFDDSSIAKILNLVQNANSKKAKTELLIRKLAKIYTPIVVYLALAICILPYFFVADYIFSEWLYRALIFLVISCPCALVISIPLGYFGGLGAASKNGILFKGAKYMDILTSINCLVLDKTGTLTKGIFEIKEIVTSAEYSESEFMSFLIALENSSNHPIAKAIKRYPKKINAYKSLEFKEIAGMGLTAYIEGQKIIAGNTKILTLNNIQYPETIESIVETVVLLAIDNTYAGHVIIADEIKEDAIATIKGIKNLGINTIQILSGDKQSITSSVAKEVGIDIALGGLMPEDKLREIEKLKLNPKLKVAFIGDGINDAPVLAASDLGLAMGGMGSDVAIETADIIIQTDQPSKIITAIKISQQTQKIIWQNIVMAFGVKIIVLILGAVGLATMWGAVFADVGVALLAILNAVRLQKMKW